MSLVSDDDPSSAGAATVVILAVALLGFGVVLILAEAHMSSGGMLATGACGAVIAAVVLLMVAAGAGATLVLAVAACVAAATMSLLIVGRHGVLRILRARPRTGREALVGRVGVVRSDSSPKLEIFVEGALWRAEHDAGHDEGELHDGDRVVVESIYGLTLSVRKAEEWELVR